MTNPIDSTKKEPLFFQAHPLKEENRSDKVKRIAFNIFSVIVFPVGIARLLRKGVHYLASLAIVPGQCMQGERLPQFRSLLMQNYQAEPLFLKTADGCVLDGMHIPGKNEGKTVAKTAPTIIYFNGNAQFYEHHSAYSIKEGAVIPFSPLKRWVDAGYNVLLFNYRGVGNSKGWATKEGLVLDGEAVYQYAHEKIGVAEKDILLWGHSLGGSVAAEVAANHPNVQLCHMRSFSSLKTEVRHLLNSRLLSWAIPLIGWNSSITECWNRVKGKKIVVYHQNDEIIPYAASLMASLKGQGLKNKAMQLGSQEAAVNEGLASYAPSLNPAQTERVKAFLNKFYESAHNRSLTPSELNCLLSYFKA